MAFQEMAAAVFDYQKYRVTESIPNDLADDDFFDLRINNLLILDDLFSEVGKDKRITDLFTEGSHHRSLSVVSINQNIFGNKDPTQRRTCHHLVLFNNQVDRQSLMTLARQMYPGHTDKFMNAFAKATKYPYGYLLVDLKPFTAEDDRLKYDLKLKSMAGKGKACDDCGLLFDSAHDVQRHVKRGCCPETRETMGEPPSYDQYIDDGYNEGDSYEMASERTQPYKERLFFANYQRLLERYWLPLVTNASHRIIVEQIDNLRQKGVSLPSSAVKRVLRKYQHEFQDLFELSDDSGKESDDESTFVNILTSCKYYPLKKVFSKTYTSLYAFSGQEFKAKRVQDVVRKFDVHYFPTQNETKASTSERAILTIKQKLYRYFNHKDNYNYISVLQNIADSYNNTYHGTIDMQPADVKENNQEECLLELTIRRIQERYFAYIQGTTEAYYQSTDYKIYRAMIFKEHFMKKVHVDSDQTWKVENVLKRRGKGRNKQYFVKWKYYPKKLLDKC
ncbi:YMD3-like protein [Mya arenaria]|uniref:YMD3-like protein n=1 Tax=Mya arenaria TaxID=6604 RepID=A0ABY7DAZ4_MYAAR|nr:YMD3-like protein [Mya arenaria]